MLNTLIGPYAIETNIYPAVQNDQPPIVGLTAHHKKPQKFLS